MSDELEQQVHRIADEMIRAVKRQDAAAYSAAETRLNHALNDIASNVLTQQRAEQSA